MRFILSLIFVPNVKPSSKQINSPLLQPPIKSSGGGGQQITTHYFAGYQSIILTNYTSDSNQRIFTAINKPIVFLHNQHYIELQP